MPWRLRCLLDEADGRLLRRAMAQQIGASDTLALGQLSELGEESLPLGWTHDVLLQGKA